MTIKSLIIGSSSAAALLFSSNAGAADIVRTNSLPIVPSIVGSSFSWVSSYLGIEAGYANGKFLSLTNGPKVSAEEFKGLAGEPKGGLVGIFGGFNNKLGNNIIGGLEGNIDLRNQNSHGTKEADNVNDGTYISTNTKMTGAVRVRLGYAIGHLLPYVSGGISALVYQGGRGTDHSVKGELDGIKLKNRIALGWNLGAGVEYALTNNFLVRADYRYDCFYNLEGKDIKIHPASCKEVKFANLGSNSLRIGAAYKF